MVDLAENLKRLGRRMAKPAPYKRTRAACKVARWLTPLFPENAWLSLRKAD
jgi:hypothetical protein